MSNADRMANPRKACPYCDNSAISIEVTALSGWVDYFRCPACGAAWHVPRGRNWPVKIVAQPTRDKLSA
jgi:transposase-like protein